MTPSSSRCARGLRRVEWNHVPMKVLLITHGSRGDVQPFAGLARALQRAGHRVTLAAPLASAWLAESYCERIVPLHDGPNVLASDTEVVKGLESAFRGARGPWRFLTTVPKTRRLVASVLDDLGHMARSMVADGTGDFDVAVHHVAGAGHDIAEFLGVPSVLMCPQPYWVPTATFPDPSFPWRGHRRFNRATYVASRTVWWAFSGSGSRWRRENLGLPPRRGARYRQPDGTPTTVVHPFSQRLLPSETDYPPWVHTTGFWFMPATQNWTPPERLRTFLTKGSPPVYLGFASTVSSDPRRLGRIVKEAVALAGVRAVVVGGWSGISADDFEDDVLFADDVPFEWLFQRVAAIVHHGGLGSTGAAMAAGRPQVVCPLLPDQWFNARRLHAMGVAPPPVPQRRLTADDLGRAIRHAVNEHDLTHNAHLLGQQIRAEDGLAPTVRLLESVARARGGRPGVTDEIRDHMRHVPHLTESSEATQR